MERPGGAAAQSPPPVSLGRWESDTRLEGWDRVEGKGIIATACLSFAYLLVCSKELKRRAVSEPPLLSVAARQLLLETARQQALLDGGVGNGWGERTKHSQHG